ncbi:U32 family peptidase [uncultured Ruegeria sp.]|uniref:ubiquinone anaerobic biosynthesis protein UbiV n=1 Tax=uncultured Ruegeria sp. TaxID=259304 RepID=UPI0026051AEE|nr:U32 family peptidase [uncultured Ruegeria sp.]
MDLTVGPNQFFWSAETWAAFYTDLAQSLVDRVVVGELVCSKRLPFYQDRIPETISRLVEAGKEVALTSLALVTLKRERKLTADLAAMGVMVEINDLTALAHLPENCAFAVGPLVNVYNEGTLKWLAAQGARRICLPPELPIASVKALTQVASDLGVAVEVWGHGRLPLAISGRCYHARLHGRSKDNCQFACEDDPDGLDVLTGDGKPFMAMNGVQTLSDSYACTDHQIDLLRQAGVSALRLSPQSDGFLKLCKLYRQRLDGDLPRGDLERSLRTADPNVRLSDGFLTGSHGAEWSGESGARSAAS